MGFERNLIQLGTVCEDQFSIARMNGDSYSSRDSGRHGSSRDYSSRDDRRGDRGGNRDRRRSRSPHGHRDRDSRPARRDGEVDSYSTDRNYREREREDRYSGRDRRGGGDRGDREGFGGGQDRGDRQKSASPPPKKKEQTPDLTDVVSILERKRRLSQ